MTQWAALLVFGVLGEWRKISCYIIAICMIIGILCDYMQQKTHFWIVSSLPAASRPTSKAAHALWCCNAMSNNQLHTQITRLMSLLICHNPPTCAYSTLVKRYPTFKKTITERLIYMSHQSQENTRKEIKSCFYDKVTLCKNVVSIYYSVAPWSWCLKIAWQKYIAALR